MKQIALSVRTEMIRYALVDDEDYKDLSLSTWTFCNRYAYRYRNGRNNEPMHRAIMEKHGYDISGLQIDHINGDGLDNRKENLRVANSSENTINRAKLAGNNTSGYNGVKWSDKHEKWEATLGLKRKRLFGGYYDSVEEAAISYNVMTVYHFGEYAFVNWLPFTKCLLLEVIQKMNNPKKTKATSQYKGVSRDKNRWVTQATFNHHVYHIGSFIDEIEAAIAYDRFTLENETGKKTNFRYDANGKVVGKEQKYNPEIYEKLYDEGAFLDKTCYLSAVRRLSAQGTPIWNPALPIPETATDT